MKEEENNAVIELINEEGSTESFEHVMTVSYKESPYLIMHPLDAEDEGEVVVMSIQAGEDGTESYEIVTDEHLAENVFREFQMILEADEFEDQE